jgi:hypothetical protein
MEVPIPWAGMLRHCCSGRSPPSEEEEPEVRRIRLSVSGFAFLSAVASEQDWALVDGTVATPVKITGNACATSAHSDGTGSGIEAKSSLLDHEGQLEARIDLGT